MEPTLAIQTAAILFGIGAMGGLVMAGIRLKGAPRPPSSLAMFHGLLGGAGLTLLIYFAVTTGLPPVAQIATGVLALAAAGGVFINLRYHSKMLALPIWLVIVHGLLAAGGLVLLLMAVFQTPAT